MTSKITKILLPLIILLAAVLRFYQLGQVPPSLDWDEVSNGYNAYSILKTGRDEYGKLLPLYNRSFDDYKPPMLMYLQIPAIATLGLNSVAVRLPSAILGTLTVLLVYFLTREIFTNEKSQIIALMAALFLAISPWHIQFSRIAFESNIGLFFTTAAVTFFLLGLKSNRWFSIASSIFFGLSLYTYHAERIIAPLLGLTLVIIYREKVLKIPPKFIAILLATFFIIVAPLVFFVPRQALFGRLDSSSNDASVIRGEKSIQLIKEDQEANFPLGFLIHNRRVITLQEYFGSYLSHFNFNFLFIKGDGNFRHHIQDMGVLYIFEMPLILFGTYKLIKNDISKSTILIFVWLLVSPIAAAPVTPTPHANRTLPMVIPFEIITAYAVTQIIICSCKFKKQILFFIATVVTVSFLVYTHNYFSHYKVEKASFWQYGYGEAALQSASYSQQFQKVIIDKSLEQSYIFWLFYLKYDPKQYQASGSPRQFDKYFFDEKIPQGPEDLFVAAADKFPEGFVTLKTINYPDGTPVIKLGHKSK